jgi:threonine aldolase
MSDKFPRKIHFASDNYSGVCPEAIENINKANTGCDYPYGEDRWTEEACDLFREMFETDCEVFFVYNGTSANALALSSMFKSYHSIICNEFAHIETDECGAPEFFSNGAKILLGNGDDGKISSKSTEEIILRRSDIHYPKPKVLSITQSTEVGTVYKPEELLELYKVTKKHNLKLHMDGARLSNAIASLDITPKEITWQCGVDVLCFGGVKNGLMYGEAVVFFTKDLADEFDYRCKQSGQLASKMRFIAAQWSGLLKTKTWYKNAKNANDCAKELENKLRNIEEINFIFPCEANALFINLPLKSIEYLKSNGWHFYTFIGAGGVRLMCSWDTTKEEINDLVEDIKNSLKS